MRARKDDLLGCVCVCVGEGQRGGDSYSPQESKTKVQLLCARQHRGYCFRTSQEVGWTEPCFPRHQQLKNAGHLKEHYSKRIDSRKGMLKYHVQRRPISRVETCPDTGVKHPMLNLPGVGLVYECISQKQEAALIPADKWEKYSRCWCTVDKWKQGQKMR